MYNYSSISDIKYGPKEISKDIYSYAHHKFNEITMYGKQAYRHKKYKQHSMFYDNKYYFDKNNRYNRWKKENIFKQIYLSVKRYGYKNIVFARFRLQYLNCIYKFKRGW